MQPGRKCLQPLGPVLGFGIELVGGIRGDWGVCHDRSSVPVRGGSDRAGGRGNGGITCV